MDDTLAGMGFTIHVDVGADGKVTCRVEGAEGVEWLEGVGLVHGNPPNRAARHSRPLPVKLVKRIYWVIYRAPEGGATKSHILRAAQPYKVGEVNAALARLIETHRIEGVYAHNTKGGYGKMVYRVIAPKLNVTLWDEE